MIEEIWKDIKGYEGKYQISNTGNVKSLHYHRGNKEKILAPRCVTKNNGEQLYYYVMLSKNNHVKCCKIHRLVAEHFVPNPQNKPYVNHKDGNKHNNNANNLEWVTPLENNLHAYHVLKKHPMKGYKYDKNKTSRKVEQWYVAENGYKYHIATYANIKAASIINNLHATSISQCCKGNSLYGQVGGYIWQYAEEQKKTNGVVSKKQTL